MVATKATSTESAACHITTAPALETHNNFLLQDADVGLGLVKLAKVPPTRDELTSSPSYPEVVLMGPVCLSENSFSMEDRQNRDSSPFFTPPLSRLLDRRARVLARHHFQGSICYVCLE